MQLSKSTGTATNPSGGPNTAAAESSGGGGETVSCLPGQEANSNLGVCVDPVCGPGTQRDPTGQTRYCVAITCPPGETFNTDINQCISVNPPPNHMCPDGSQGTLEQSGTGISAVVGPKSLPPPTPPPPGSK